MCTMNFTSNVSLYTSRVYELMRIIYGLGEYVAYIEKARK